MISVCMATYNGEKYIQEQIDSILAQLDEGDEIVISDDGSKDNTVRILDNYQDIRIKIIVNEGNRGYTSNFYNALKEAKGDIILLSDQDDIWCENKVEVMKKELEKFDFVHSDAIVVDQNKRVMSASRNLQHKVKKGFFPNLLRSRYIGCCMGFTKIVKECLFPVPVYSNKYPHDLWIALIAEKYFKSACIDEGLIFYRRHDSNASNGGTAEKSNFVQMFNKILVRFYYFYYVFKQRKHVKLVKERFEYK